MWKNFVDKLKQAANSSVSDLHKIPLSPSRRKALADVKKWSFRNKMKPYNQSAIKQKKNAKATFSRLCKEKESRDQKQFFENLKNYKVGERISRAHQYMKKHRKNSSSTRKPNISMRKWRIGEEGNFLLPEKIDMSGEVQCNMPDIDDLDTIIRESKNNKAPRLDNIPAELIKYADTVTKDEFKGILKRIWSENSLPSE